MAVKRGLNMAKGLESLIPQGKRSAGNQGSSQNASPKSSEENTEAKKDDINTVKIEGTADKDSERTKQTSGKTTKKAASKKTGKSAPKAAGANEVKETKKVNEADKADKADKTDSPVNLRISQVIPNQSQPRSVFDEGALDELAESIRQFGVLQPILVQKSGNYYEIIAGERRWRAAKRAGLKEIPVIIRDFSRQEVVEISLIENIQREDLNPIEEARAYKRLLEEFELKQEDVAARVSKSRSAVTNSMRLLNLDERVQELLVSGQISAGHARALLSLESGELQFMAAQEVSAGSLSVRDTEQLVKRMMNPKRIRGKKPVDTQLEAAYHAIEEQLTERMGTKVSIQRGRGKRGKIEIEYYSQDDLNRIIDLIR